MRIRHRLLALVAVVLVVGAVGAAGMPPEQEAHLQALQAQRFQLRAFVPVTGTAMVIDGLIAGSAGPRDVGGTDRRAFEHEAVRLVHEEAVRLLQEAEPDVGIAVHEHRALDEMKRVDTRLFTDHAVEVAFTLPFQQGPAG